MNLYLMDSSELKPREVLAGIVDPIGLRWSPDGTLLAFGTAGDESPGAWVFRPLAKTLVRISTRVDVGLSWSPRGDQIIAQREGGQPLNDYLVLLNLPANLL